MATNSQKQAVTYREQPILPYAERVADAKIAAEAAEEEMVRAILAFRDKNAASRTAAYSYAEVLEARLKVRDLPPAA